MRKAGCARVTQGFRIDMSTPTTPTTPTISGHCAVVMRHLSRRSGSDVNLPLSTPQSPKADDPMRLKAINLDVGVIVVILTHRCKTKRSSGVDGEM
jgi:hypothetical protein